jgi:hypothetical protein
LRTRPWRAAKSAAFRAKNSRLRRALAA